jgi:hypothetical protein
MFASDQKGSERTSASVRSGNPTSAIEIGWTVAFHASRDDEPIEVNELDGMGSLPGEMIVSASNNPFVRCHGIAAVT